MHRSRFDNIHSYVSVVVVGGGFFCVVRCYPLRNEHVIMGKSIYIRNVNIIPTKFPFNTAICFMCLR